MRLILAIWLGKLIFFFSRLLGKGGGSAAPGYYALKIEPKLISKLSKQIPQNIVITGTNGKTTTARMLNHFVTSQHLKIVRNSTGSNLQRGVASTLIAHADLSGKVKADLGIWELDESAFNSVLFDLKPQIMVFLNAFRDQLDRYGEVDSVVKKWRDSLEKINWEIAIVVNGSDNHTWSLTDTTNYKLPTTNFYEFRVKNYELTQEKITTNQTKHRDDFVAIITKNKGLEGLEFELKFPDEKLKINLPIPGIYHVFDFLAAFSVYYLLNLPLNQVNAHLQSYLPAFGRVEKIKLKDHEAYIFLIKNPTGASEVFSTIAPELKMGDRLLIALNDNFADGTDVSWIWDAQFELLNLSLRGAKRRSNLIESKKDNPRLNKIATGLSDPRNDIKIICSGTRAQDLAVRLKYAGMDTNSLVTTISLKTALSEAQEGLQGRLFILPTYTALLELQKLLTEAGVKQHYWKEAK